MDSPHASGGCPYECLLEGTHIEIGGRRIHYLKAGSGPTVVLLHGGASDSRDWISTIHALCDSHTCYALDMVGFGLSDRSKDGYCLSDFVECTLGFVEALGLERPDLVGHSLGGRVCLDIALRRPDDVRKLVLVDSAGFSKLGWWGSVMGTVAWTARRVLRLPKPYPTFRKENGAYADWVCLNELPDLRVSTLVVWSRFDPYYPLDGARKAVNVMPDARLEVLPCFGHAPHVRKKDSFNSLLRDFLDSG
ncbi:MAG: alpha/beta fold hydrolase [Chloroflexi bacterium]|nr:alpha/beta fold hydrolase [Chloroflexota bacterium]